LALFFKRGIVGELRCLCNRFTEIFCVLQQQFDAAAEAFETAYGRASARPWNTNPSTCFNDAFGRL
jgi:hypothetical protein